MKEIERNVFLSDELFENEYEYMFGSKKDEIVTIIYYNTKTDKETVKRFWNYKLTLATAHGKAIDKRCKNFQYYIQK